MNNSVCKIQITRKSTSFLLVYLSWFWVGLMWKWIGAAGLLGKKDLSIRMSYRLYNLEERGFISPETIKLCFKLVFFSEA